MLCDMHLERLGESILQTGRWSKLLIGNVHTLKDIAKQDMGCFQFFIVAHNLEWLSESFIKQGTTTGTKLACLKIPKQKHLLEMADILLPWQAFGTQRVQPRWQALYLWNEQVDDQKLASNAHGLSNWQRYSLRTHSAGHLNTLWGYLRIPAAERIQRFRKEHFRIVPTFITSCFLLDA